jgi:hypothetical protein
MEFQVLFLVSFFVSLVVNYTSSTKNVDSSVLDIGTISCYFIIAFTYRFLKCRDCFGCGPAALCDLWFHSETKVYSFLNSPSVR